MIRRDPQNCKEAWENSQAGEEKTGRANEHEDLLVHKSEVEASSGDAKTERGSKGIWYPEELDRDLWRG